MGSTAICFGPMSDSVTKKGTLRALHFQKTPFAEAKIVRGTRGSTDVIVDLRTDSPTSHR